MCVCGGGGGGGGGQRCLWFCSTSDLQLDFRNTYVSISGFGGLLVGNQALLKILEGIMHSDPHA